MTEQLQQEGSRLPWGAVECVCTMTNAPIRQIAKEFRMRVGTLRAEIKRRGWRRVNGAQGPESMRKSPGLVARLAHIAEREIAAVERERKRPARLTEVERLARLVGRIAQLEERGSDAQPHNSHEGDEPRVVDDARRLEIARRLEGLRQQSEFEREARPPRL